MDDKLDIIIIGLGVMGRSIALNLVDHGFKIHVYNRTYSKVEDILKYSENIKGYKTLQELANGCKQRRLILMEVNAGKLIDEFLEKLEFLFDSRDIVVDCGNSDFNDTIRREKSSKFNYVGMGVSGGEIGARYGPSMMIGCKKEIFDIIGPIFKKISAKNGKITCCTWMGENGAGHFVKTVHNGIEYVEMQLYQEIYNIFYKFKKEDQILDFFKNFKERLQSFLVDCCVKVLQKKNEKGFLINQILDKAQQKGTGKMCINSTLELGVENGAMAESVFARFLSSRKEDRINFSKITKNSFEPENFNLDFETLEKAVYLCKAVAFIQGFNLLFAQKREKNWNYTINDLCDVWSNGCIIRCSFLEILREIPCENFLEGSEPFIKIYNECYSSLKKTCIFINENEIYAPVFSSVYMWLNGLKMSEKNGVLIQAMRDYFGCHGVVLEGEFVNIDWENSDN